MQKNSETSHLPKLALYYNTLYYNKGVGGRNQYKINACRNGYFQISWEEI